MYRPSAIALIAVLLIANEAAAQQAPKNDPTTHVGKPPPPVDDRAAFTGHARAHETLDECIRFQAWAGELDPETGRPAPGPPQWPQREPSVLFPGRVAHGGYGGPAVKITRVLSEPAALAGVQGGWIVDHAWTLGVAAYGLASRHDAPVATRVNDELSRIELVYGGIRLGYLLQPHRLVHLGGSLTVGPGGLVSVSRREDAFDDERHTGHGDLLIAVEPELEGELNVVRFMRVALSASYRYLGAVDAPGLSSRKLSAPAGSLVMRFGAF